MTSTVTSTAPTSFVIEKPSFDPSSRQAFFSYRLGELAFIETLTFPEGLNASACDSNAFKTLLGLTGLVLGTSYYKLKAPFDIVVQGFGLSASQRDFAIDLYENGLAEFYARNDLKRFGKLNLTAKTSDERKDTGEMTLTPRILLPIGGGKDSLVSVQLLEKAGLDYTPFAVNPKGPILSSVEVIGKAPLYVRRTLDAEMIRLGSQPGYYNGHVPSTAINSMIAALTALLYDYSAIALSNERSASEGNVEFDGRIANHQYSKSLAFEGRIADILSTATGGALAYFSLLRPYSEAKIAKLFARETRFDRAFSSCNQNFRLSGHDGALWCGKCPKCHFTFLMLAPETDKNRLITIFGADLLDNAENEMPYRELTGLAGQKPWECVGEILEAAACLWALTKMDDWKEVAIVSALANDLERQYGASVLTSAYTDLMTDSDEHQIPTPEFDKVAPHAI